MILEDDEEKKYYIMDEEEVDCAGVWQSSRESIPVEILEPQWDNEKIYLKLGKNNRVTFEDEMKNTKTETNHNLSTQTIENSKFTE